MKDLRNKIVNAAQSLDDYRKGLDPELAKITSSKLAAVQAAQEIADTSPSTSRTKNKARVEGARRAYESVALETEMDRRNKKREID